MMPAIIRQVQIVVRPREQPTSGGTRAGGAAVMLPESLRASLVEAAKASNTNLETLAWGAPGRRDTLARNGQRIRETSK